MHLAQEYRYINDESTAIEYCREGSMLAAGEDKIYPSEMWMQIHLPVMLSAIGKQKKVLDEGERILRLPRLLEVGQAHLYSVLATLCLDLNEYKKGLSHVRSLIRTLDI